MEQLKVEGFLVNQEVGLFGSTSGARRKTALNFAIKNIEKNYENNFQYKCNYDALVEIKPGCFRKIVRFILRKEQEESIMIKYKYAIFQKSTLPVLPCNFVEIEPVSAEHELGVLSNEKNHDPYLESGRLAIEDFLNQSPELRPYCDVEVMVKYRSGWFKRLWNVLSGNSYKNKFSFDFFEFNIAQSFKSK